MAFKLHFVALRRRRLECRLGGVAAIRQILLLFLAYAIVAIVVVVSCSACDLSDFIVIAINVIKSAK